MTALPASLGFRLENANSEGRPQRPPRPLPPDQDQRGRLEVWADDFDPSLVLAGRPDSLPVASPGFRHILECWACANYRAEPTTKYASYIVE
jgi:hypothetical protein